MSGIFDQVINYAPPSLLKGTVTYKGTWSAATNTPTLVNPPDSTTNGNYYVVSAAGTQFSLVFNIGDWIISNGSAWEKVDNTDAVSSVFGRTGAVVGVSTDYSSVGITATAVGASSPSTGAFTTLSATTPLAATSGGTGLSSLGTGVATFLGTPSSANLAAAVTNETGSGVLVFGTSPTITTPVIAQINDAGGNETLKLASIASAVNEVTIENAATGNAVHISATGGDASVGLHLAGKGASGYVNVQDSTDATKRIMFNAAGGTTNTRTMLSSTQTVDRTLSLPDATDTLVGKATTDTLTNKTLTSPTLTAPVLGTPASGTVTNLTGTASININGTVGATTPAAGSFTTLATTGQITSTVASGTVTLESTAPYGTGYKAIRLGNNGSTLTVGVESSAGGSLLTSATGYAGVVSSNSTVLQLGASNTIVATLSAGAAAITGALSATGAITSTGGSNPSSGTTAVTAYVSGANAELAWISSGGAANAKIWDAYNDGAALHFRAVNDAFNAATDWLTVTRSGASPTLITLAATSGVAVTGAGSYSGLLTTSNGITNTTVSIKSTLTYGPVYQATENNTDNVGRSSFNFIRGTTNVGQIVTTNSTCAYNSVSDYRLKEIIGLVEDSGKFIDGLKPKVGTWKSNGDKFVGFIAHEFAEISPSSVTGKKDAVDADGKPVYQSMQAGTSEVIANLVAELQSLRKRLAALESK